MIENYATLPPDINTLKRISRLKRSDFSLRKIDRAKLDFQAGTVKAILMFIDREIVVDLTERLQ